MNILVTSGCSFSVVKHECWPYHLAKHINPSQEIHTGVSCQGNDLISKKIIYQVITLLKNNLASDLLVGIMWSGTDRKAIYLDNPKPNLPKLRHCLPNPNSVVEGKNKWYMLNSRAYDNLGEYGLSRMHYEHFHSEIGSMITTCEEILKTQWFLQKHNIRYFMSTYLANVLPDEMKTNPEISYLYNQIDFDTFLPVTGEYEWCKENCNSEFKDNDMHPVPSQHEKFTNAVIIPFLKEKQYI